MLLSGARALMSARALVCAALLSVASGQVPRRRRTPFGGRAETNAAAFATTMQCRVSLQNMLYNKDWEFMNNTMMRWCRIKLENKMSACCSNAEFAKGKADSCSDCIADCVHTKMRDMCNTHFGKACTLTRKPFDKNNVSMKVTETFCVPKDCYNSEDLDNNLIVKWYDAQYRRDRMALWLYDYGASEDLKCPSMVVAITLGVIGSIFVIIISIPVGLFLFKAPKERGRVLRGADDDEFHEDQDEVEPFGLPPPQAIQDASLSGTK